MNGSNARLNGTHNHAPGVGGGGKSTKKGAGQGKGDAVVNPQAMYESLKSKIAALEEELNHAGEEESKFVEEAQKSVRGLEENAVHTKYVELYSEMKRIERDHAKERQKLTKDKDAAKNQLAKANQAKTKLENFARDLTKDCKKLREEKAQLLQEVAKGIEEIKQLTSEIAKGRDKARQQELKNRESPDIVVKVVCKYRAELFFKIPRKAKLSRLFAAWTERMESGAALAMAGIKPIDSNSPWLATPAGGNETSSPNHATSVTMHKSDTTNGTQAPNGPTPTLPQVAPMMFMYTHQGRSLDPDLTVEEAGIEHSDEILAVELMDLTGPMPDDVEEIVELNRPTLNKNWTDNPKEAKKAMEDIFDGVTKERLKLILRQYELRERHFECFIRSKELELLLMRYREEEQRHLADYERSQRSRLEEDNHQVRKELEDAHNGQTLLIEKLVQCCKEPNAERTQRLFTSLREELEKRGTKLGDGIAVG